MAGMSDAQRARPNGRRRNTKVRERLAEGALNIRLPSGEVCVLMADLMRPEIREWLSRLILEWSGQRYSPIGTVMSRADKEMYRSTAVGLASY